MLKRTLTVDAAEADQLMFVADLCHQVSSQSSCRVCFECDLPSSMTVVEFFACFECQMTVSSVCSHVSLLPSLSDVKKMKLGLYFVLNSASLLPTYSQSKIDFCSAVTFVGIKLIFFGVRLI